jgi:hypothetical protein
MPGNYSAKKGWGTTITTAQLEMRAYDMLPPTLRRAVDEAPYSMSSEAVLTIHLKNGWQAALKEIKASAAGFVGAKEWRPISRIGHGSSSGRSGRRASVGPVAARGRRNLQRWGHTIPTVAEF